MTIFLLLFSFFEMDGDEINFQMVPVDMNLQKEMSKSFMISKHIQGATARL